MDRFGKLYPGYNFIFFSPIMFLAGEPVTHPLHVQYGDGLVCIIDMGTMLTSWLVLIREDNSQGQPTRYPVRHPGEEDAIRRGRAW